MANVAVVGAQWGDEGKGKIVDWLSRARRCRRALPGRPQRRPHAGHRRRRPTSCRLLPSGVVRPGKLSIIGNGVVSIPGRCSTRSSALREQGVDDRARQPAHRRERAADPAAARRARPRARGARAARRKIGTTGRGIGPAYEDKVGAPRDPGLRPRRPDGARRPGRRAAAAPQRAAARASARRRSTARELLAAAARDRAEGAALSPTPVWQLLDEARRAGAPHPVRGRAGRACSTSTTAPIPTSPRRTRVAGQAAAGSGIGADARSASCSASPRPTRRASARARSRPS